MKSPENYSSKTNLNGIKQNCFMKPNFIDIFSVKNNWLSDSISISDIQAEVNELVWNLGGPAKASKLINCNYSTLHDWHLGRAPIPLLQLKKLLEKASKSFAFQIKNKIRKKELFLKVQKSYHNSVKFPKYLTPELAYIIGVILGDGHLHNNKGNKRGNWLIGVYFDNMSHLKIYSDFVKGIFNINPKTSKIKDKRNYSSYFCSKAIHWYLRTFFELPNGNKSARIEIPKLILNSNKEICGSFLSGLFDSDGTIAKSGKRKYLKFASASKKIIDQVYSQLKDFGITCYKHHWLKNEKYKMLFDVSVYDPQSILKFNKEISFKHPLKKQKLESYVFFLSAR